MASSSMKNRSLSSSFHDAATFNVEVPVRALVAPLPVTATAVMRADDSDPCHDTAGEPHLRRNPHRHFSDAKESTMGSLFLDLCLSHGQLEQNSWRGSEGAGRRWGKSGHGCGAHGGIYDAEDGDEGNGG